MDFTHFTSICEVCGERYWDVIADGIQLGCANCASEDLFGNFIYCTSCGSYTLSYDKLGICDCCSYLLDRGKFTEKLGVSSTGVPRGEDISNCIYCGNIIINTIEGGVCRGCDICPVTTNIKPAVR